MKLAIIGLGHAYQKQVNAILKIKEIEITAVCDVNDSLLKLCGVDTFKTKDYKELLGRCDSVLIASPPSTHLEIAKFFIVNKVNVILEKPIVTSLKELEEFNELLVKHQSSFYNTLHFSFGDEIIWFKQNLSHLIPKKIKALICDRYVEDFSIISKAVSLHGAYLDESINPLSAIAYIYGYNITAKTLEKKKFEKDRYDYYSLSRFELDNIPIEIEVDWNRDSSDKYIDLIFDDKIIRLDSMNQQVIDLSNNEILFSSSGDRMTNHYFNSFMYMLKNRENSKQSINLHKELLKIYEN